MTCYAEEPLVDLFKSSKLVTLDFQKIPSNTPAPQNIKNYFETCVSQFIDPKKPENRQKFNDAMIEATGFRYLIGQYGEDRSSMLKGSEIQKQGRTIHLGVDIFCKDLEPVFSPCDGIVIAASTELGGHTFGHFVLIKPDDMTLPLMFLGHLSSDSKPRGKVHAGQQIGFLGDYRDNENGGWSRHLHLQLCRTRPDGDLPLGYATPQQFAQIGHEIPNPIDFFKDWKIVY